MKRLILTLLVMASSVSASAQSLDECRQMARDHYPKIRHYDLISLSEQYNLSNARRAWIPQIAISGQATYQSATPTYPEVFNSLLEANGVDMSGIRADQYRVAVNISQNIWDGGQSRVDSAIAEAEATEQRSSVDVALYDLEARVDNLYFGILLLDERVAQTEALIAVLRSNLERIKAYRTNGVAMQSDVDMVEAELLTAEQTLAEVESSRASYRRMLELFIGEQLHDQKLTRPTATVPTQRSSLRPELELFSAQERRIEAQQQAVNTSVMPRFSAFVEGYYGYPGLDMFRSMVSAEWSVNAIVGIRMSWNIGAFYTKRNNLERLGVARQNVELQRDIFLFNTELQVAEQDGEIVRLQRAIEDDKRIVELRRRVRMAAESQLENGVIDATELLRKITDETHATLNQTVHEIELLQTIYRLKHTLNQ